MKKVDMLSEKEMRRQILQQKIAWQTNKNKWKRYDGNSLKIQELYEKIPYLDGIYQVYLEAWKTMTPTEKIPISIKGKQRYQEIVKKMHLEAHKQYYAKGVVGWALLELTDLQKATEQLWENGQGFLLVDTEEQKIKDVDIDSGDEYHISIYIWDFGKIDEKKDL